MLLLPPANLPLLAVAGLIVRRWHRRLGELLTAVCCVLLLVLSMPFFGGTLLVALEQHLPSDAARTSLAPACRYIQESVPGRSMSKLWWACFRVET